MSIGSTVNPIGNAGTDNAGIRKTITAGLLELMYEPKVIKRASCYLPDRMDWSEPA